MAKRGRPRRTVINLNDPEAAAVLNGTAFPSIDAQDSVPFAASLSADASEKRKIADAAKEIPQIFTPEQVAWLFDAYVGLLSFVYSVVLKSDYNAISTELAFTAEQKEQMSKPLARILSKHAPSELAGMSSEIELITCLGIWTVSSFARAKKAAEKTEHQKQRKERTEPVSPMRHPDFATA